ncbi:DUF2917 domain-containing protein [bacterium]|nr:MAG: DUF2917 domain-containing protein [bacterium]
MTLTLTSHHSKVGLKLDRDAVVDLHPSREGLTRGGITLRVREGRLWITQTGDPNDHVVGVGESFHTDAPGLLVVQALEPSVVNAA